MSFLSQLSLQDRLTWSARTSFALAAPCIFIPILVPFGVAIGFSFLDLKKRVDATENGTRSGRGWLIVRAVMMLLLTVVTGWFFFLVSMEWDIVLGDLGAFVVRFGILGLALFQLDSLRRGVHFVVAPTHAAASIAHDITRKGKHAEAVSQRKADRHRVLAAIQTERREKLVARFGPTAVGVGLNSARTNYFFNGQATADGLKLGGGLMMLATFLAVGYMSLDIMSEASTSYRPDAAAFLGGIFIIFLIVVGSVCFAIGGAIFTAGAKLNITPIPVFLLSVCMIMLLMQFSTEQAADLETARYFAERGAENEALFGKSLPYIFLAPALASFIQIIGNLLGEPRLTIEGKDNR